MAMLFENPLDEFNLDEFLKFYPDPVSSSSLNTNFCCEITCTRITCSHSANTDIWDKFNLSSLPTPPLSPDQQVPLKVEDDLDVESDFLKIESEFFKSEPMDYTFTNADAEVERYFNIQPNNYVINDKIWCDDENLTSTPNPVDLNTDNFLSSSFLKFRTPTLDLGNLTTNIMRPITPQTPIKIEEKTPVKIFSPPKKVKPCVRKSPPKFELGQFPLINIKEEPRSPSPIKTSGVSSRGEPAFPVIHIKDEPMDYDSSVVTTQVKEEKPAAPGPRAIRTRKQLEPDPLDIPDFRTLSEYKRINPTYKRYIKTETKREPVDDIICLRSNSISEDDDLDEDVKIDETYLKRKLAELSSDVSSSENDITSPKRRIRHQRYNSSVLAENIANKLSHEQIRNLSNNHSHGEDEPCDESCTKRFAHSVMERKRRNDLKRSYELVQRQVPEISNNDKVAKVVILKKSAEYIKKLEQEEMESRAELKRQKAYQRQLINKFQMMVKAAANKTCKVKKEN